MISLALNSDGDLYLTGYSLTRITGAALVAQRLRVRLRLFRGEWFLDESAGVPYFTDILVSSPRLALVEAVLRTAILAGEDIESLKKFSMTYDRAMRTLTVTFTVVSTEGEIEIEEVWP